jgi:hypothetical protein
MAPTAAKATSPNGVDHLPETAMVVPTTVTAQMLMAMASASLSPASPRRNFQAHPRPGSNRHAAATMPSRRMPISPAAVRAMTKAHHNHCKPECACSSTDAPSPSDAERSVRRNPIVAVAARRFRPCFASHYFSSCSMLRAGFLMATIG